MKFKLPFRIAARYMLGKRSANVVPVLSRISMAAIAVGSCAMIVLFSVFNGFEFLVRDLYKAFYPEVKITAAKGKFFSLNDVQYYAVRNTAGIKEITNVLEDNVLLNANDEQKIATLKGIDKKYLLVNNIRPYIIEGSDSVYEQPVPNAIAGIQLLNQLGLEVKNMFTPVMVYYPNAESNVPDLNPESSFQSLRLRIDGAFKIQDDFDDKYILVSLPLAQQLLQAAGKYSSIEIKLAPGANAQEVKQLLQQKIGTSYRVETRFEQNRTLYTVMRSEKWAVYAILVLVLLIASFNMVGGLSLLVLEKQKDIAILRAMGAESITLKTVFIFEGLLWSLTGGSIGLILGALICFGQQQFHWIKMGGSFIIDAYPVEMLLTDFLLILLTICVVGISASWFPALRAARVQDPSLKSA